MLNRLDSIGVKELRILSVNTLDSLRLAHIMLNRLVSIGVKEFRILSVKTLDSLRPVGMHTICNA